MEIRQKLEKDEEALLRQRKLNEILAPDHFDIEQIQSYNVSRAVRNHPIDNCNPLYGDPEGTPGHETAATDLIPLKSREYGDFFTLWVCERSLTIINIFGRFLKTDKVSGKPTIYDAAIKMYTYYFTAVIAGLVPAVMKYMISQHEGALVKGTVMASMNLSIMGCMMFFAYVDKGYLFIVGVL
ncbi:hypothetical protein J4E91_009552 [Alternaria rosae]|nr:hypothetical protein J4E91_009552 [Alternaria rosae]